MHLLLKELLHEGKLIETLGVEEEREKRVGIHSQSQFTFRVLPACTSFKTAFSHVVHWTGHCQMWILPSSWEKRTYANTDHLSLHRIPTVVAAINTITRNVAFAQRATWHCAAVLISESNLTVENV